MGSNPTPPTVAGAFNYDGTKFQVRDATGTYDPRDVYQGTHGGVREAVHLAEIGGPFEQFPSGTYREILPVTPFPTNVCWYVDNTKTQKIVEKNITYDGQKRAIVVVVSIYASDGVTVISQFTDNINYTGRREINRTRTKTI